MKGSEKQIEWAERIKAEWIEMMDYDYARIIARESSGDLPVEFFAKVKAVREKLVNGVNGIDDARAIIDKFQKESKNFLVGQFRRLCGL